MPTSARNAICIAAALLPFGVILAAAPQPSPGGEQDEELEEVIVSGTAKIVRSPRALRSWLKRLVGQHSYGGYVELGGEGVPQERRLVSGAGNCIPLDEIAVHCEIRIRWPDVKAADGAGLPGGVSALAPAIILYGLDPTNQGIRSLLVDSLGMAHGGLGELRGNTLTTSTPCVDLPGKCSRVSRVVAQPDGKIRMEIDIELESTRVARHVFDLERVAHTRVDDSEQSQPGGARR